MQEEKPANTGFPTKREETKQNSSGIDERSGKRYNKVITIFEAEGFGCSTLGHSLRKRLM